MRTKLSWSVFFLALGCLIGVQHPTAAAQSAFSEYDGNEDGIISEDEWLARAQAEYQAFDRNRDGRISYNEFHNLPPGTRDTRFEQNGAPRGYGYRRRQPRFEEMDVNHDGVLTPGEYPVSARHYYEALDANGDGGVSYNEFFNRKEISATVLKGLDTNGDNRISRGEWTSEAAEFNRIDTNSDNFLTVAELSADSAKAAASTSSSASTGGSSLEEIFLKLLQK